MNENTQRKLTQRDVSLLVWFFKADTASPLRASPLKAQNYEAFATFSKNRGGVVDYDLAFISSFDALMRQEDLCDYRAMLSEFMGIRRQLVGDVGLHTAWVMQTAFGPRVDTNPHEAFHAAPIAALARHTRAAAKRAEETARLRVVRSAYDRARNGDATGFEVCAAVLEADARFDRETKPSLNVHELALAAIFDAMKEDSRDGRFLDDVLSDARSMLADASEAWRVARDKYEALKQKVRGLIDEAPLSPLAESLLADAAE